MRVEAFIAVLVVAATWPQSDMGCKNNYTDNRYGKCVNFGCCDGTSNPTMTLCQDKDCCHGNYLCGYTNCLNVAATWVSNFNYHATYEEIEEAFSKLSAKGINRVYFNVWADGVIYARSETALANGAVMDGDRLAMAVELAAMYNLEIYAWFEYGARTAFGDVNEFTSASIAKGWMLCLNPSSGCDQYFLDDFAYLDLMLQEVKEFLASMVADVVRNYPTLDGFQFDDHFALPNEFPLVGSTPQAEKFGHTLATAQLVRDMARNSRPDIHVSYSPSPLDFAREKHNVDWVDWLVNGVVMEVVPQYYRFTFEDFKAVLLEDLGRVRDQESGLVAGMAMGEGENETPHFDLSQMVAFTYEMNLRGVSFWFADYVINDDYYDPPFVHFC